ncbi:MAG: ATP-binding cassette domain-containing protein [Tenacibaculum sp.]|nr:ATP-binding cassette domain-containing protein [Tenacibaculum sp.]
MNHLHVDSVRKYYGTKLILSDIFLSCKQGEVKALVGRNGCGKSTLLKIIFGSEKADYRFVKVDNKVVKNISDAKNLISYLPQDNFLPNNIKIRKLINYFLGKAKAEILKQNDFIKPLLNKTNNILSGGEKRIVEILLILYSDSNFILLDEPFNGVSPIVREQIISILRTHKNQKGIIITDHDYQNVIKIADNILFLKDGNLKEIKHKNELIELGYLNI